MSTQYETIVGMEIHVELKTKSKMFCGCKNDPFHAPEPNIYTCPVCLGLPGALPVPNKKAVEWTIMLGLALGSIIQEFSKFDRKNYFYPDLPKGFQISQYDQPLCTGGRVGDVRIHRVHLEEDTGKLLHDSIDGKRVSLIDFNRSGVPLVEIVTEPDIRSGEQAKLFLKKLHQIIRYLDISDADMEKGSMRLEPNISVRKLKTQNSKLKTTTQNLKVEDLPSYKVEVKNINSFNFVKKAIEYETKRQIELLEKGEVPVQETRGWNEAKGITFPQRRKETADDYRYFPEPDIPPMRWTSHQISVISHQIGELPDEKEARFMENYSLSKQDAQQITEIREKAQYFEKVVSMNRVTPKTIANWMINRKADWEALTPEKFVDAIAASTQVVEVSNEALEQALQEVLLQNAKAVADYKAGKEQALMFLVGKLRAKVKQADISVLRSGLIEQLRR